MICDTWSCDKCDAWVAICDSWNVSCDQCDSWVAICDSWGAICDSWGAISYRYRIVSLPSFCYHENPPTEGGFEPVLDARVTWAKMYEVLYLVYIKYLPGDRWFTWKDDTSSVMTCHMSHVTWQVQGWFTPIIERSSNNYIVYLWLSFKERRAYFSSCWPFMLLTACLAGFKRKPTLHQLINLSPEFRIITNTHVSFRNPKQRGFYPEP